ncbi:MAG: hypothetical protein ABEJ58_09335 [Halodesulfurarchaeum sp.]
MPNETTLDAFREAGDSPESTAEPPKSVFVWRPDGVPCDRCGTVASGLWRVGDEYHCEPCVEWNRG